MNGEAISAQALADAGLRRLASEHGGPRPGGTRADRTAPNDVAARTARATRP